MDDMTMRSFPVEHGLRGLNRLAVFLNGLPLNGQWHFGSGTHSNQSMVDVDFDDPADAEPAWQRHRDNRIDDPPRTGK